MRVSKLGLEAGYIEGDANISETATTSPSFVQHGRSATLQVTP